MKFLTIISFYIISFSLYLNADCYNYSYVLSFNPNTYKQICFDFPLEHKLSINIFATNDSHFEINIPHLNIMERYFLKKGDSKKYSFDYSEFNLELYQHSIREPIFVNSENEVYIIMSDDLFWNTDAEKVSTNCSYGKHFIVNQYFNYDFVNHNRKNVHNLKITAQDNFTDVILRTMKNNDYYAQLQIGKNYHIRLEKGDTRTFYFINDFSGLEISSNKNIQVATSSTCINLPKNNAKYKGDEYGYADFIYTNMIPTKYLGNEYILVPFKSIKSSYHYKIVSLEDNNRIYINNKYIDTYNKGDYFQGITDSVMLIKSNFNISVTQYGNFFAVGDPCMLQNIPINQKSKFVQFVSYNSPSKKGEPSNISILKEKNDDIFLDDYIINLKFNEVPNSNYEYLDILLDEGYHEIKTSKGSIVTCFSGRPGDGICYLANNRLYSNEDEDIIVRLNNNLGKNYICSSSPFVLSADAPENAIDFDWTINDTLHIKGKEVELDLPKSGKYKIRLKVDNDENRVYEWEVTRLEPITGDLDSAIYLCNDSLTYISMNASGGSESKSITWFPANNLKDPTQFHIEFIEPLKKSQTLYYEIVDDNCCSYNDSITINITNIYPHLTATQNNFCEGDSATISLDKAYETIVWNTGETTKDIVVKTAGVYSATVTEGECLNTASLEIKVNPLPDFDVKAPNGLLICDGGSVEIEIEADPNISIQWSDNSRVRKRTFNQSGTFTITAKDIKTGCELTKEIVISDMNEIQADILGNRTFCDGESTTLTLNPEGKSYLWNTGETTQSILVKESGIYSATITSEAGCEITATKEVTKYPLPDFEILGETIICENPVAIYPNKDFVSYEWNTGANSKTITITEAGDYWLRVTDKNVCETTKSVEIKQANPELNLSTNNINFGEIIFGSTKTQTITADRDVIITKNTAKFNANINNKNINIIFNPTNIGEYIDTLIVETEGDCKATDTLYITGVCKAEILASVSNATGYPNDNISNKISLELQQQIPLPIDFNYNLTLNINQDAIYITDNTTYSYANGKLVIDIADYLNKSDYQTQIKDINSRINLARNHENPIKISNFTTDNEFLIPLRKDGNITIYEVCLDSMRLIENYTPANIQTLNRTTIILNTYESGAYKIEINDLTGKVIKKQTQTTKNSEQIKYNYELSTGTYIIKITEPGKIQTIKVIFVE